MGRTSSTPDHRSTYQQDTPEQAFRSYRKRMPESSDPQCTATSATLQVVTIEPSVDGSIHPSPGSGFNPSVSSTFASTFAEALRRSGREASPTRSFGCACGLE
jgi:hypothetical protein